jgi:tRNA(fMet)-specific endonuclease VapC
MDLMIAATAITHDLILVTHNTKDFENIPDLQMVDWLVP